MPQKKPKKKNEAAVELGKRRALKAGSSGMKAIGKKGLEKRWQKPIDNQ